MRLTAVPDGGSAANHLPAAAAQLGRKRGSCACALHCSLPSSGVVFTVLLPCEVPWARGFLALPITTLTRILCICVLPRSPRAGDAVAQIFWNAFKQRTGSGMGSVLFISIPLGGMCFCAHSALTYTAR